MTAIIAEWMVKRNKHLPQELYLEILSYLLPKHLLQTEEVIKYNKVVYEIPGFDSPGAQPRRIFSSATNSFRTVRYIYKLNRKWKKTRTNNDLAPMDRNTIIVYVPHTISASRRLTLCSPKMENHYHDVEYTVYKNQAYRGYRGDAIHLQNRRFLKRAKYGWPQTQR